MRAQRVEQLTVEDGVGCRKSFGIADCDCAVRQLLKQALVSILYRCGFLIRGEALLRFKRDLYAVEPRFDVKSFAAALPAFWPGIQAFFAQRFG